jgi:uncharacterized membrane protein YfcA
MGWTARTLLLFAASAVAGAINSVAGGGTLLTFPALILAGLDPVVANATSTVALWPGTIGGIWGYRRELDLRDPLLVWLAAPALVGGGIGAVLLLATPTSTFSSLVPYLVLFATLLFMLQGYIRPASRHSHSASRGPAWWTAAIVLELVTAVYGGYFGAGIGIMMLAMLGMLGLEDIHHMNGLKIVLGMLINGTAVALFLWGGVVDYPVAIVMVVGSAVGGYAGADLARRLGQKAVRATVVFIGLLVTALLFAQAI